MTSDNLAVVHIQIIYPESNESVHQTVRKIKGFQSAKFMSENCQMLVKFEITSDDDFERIIQEIYKNLDVADVTADVEPDDWEIKPIFD